MRLCFCVDKCVWAKTISFQQQSEPKTNPFIFWDLAVVHLSLHFKHNRNHDQVENILLTNHKTCVLIAHRNRNFHQWTPHDHSVDHITKTYKIIIMKWSYSYHMSRWLGTLWIQLLKISILIANFPPVSISFEMNILLSDPQCFASNRSMCANHISERLKNQN